MQTTLTLSVPLAAKRAAGRALLIHQQYPDVPGVQGVSVARRLAAGQVTAHDIVTLRRFFRRHEQAYHGALSQLRTEQDSAIVRSWLLHGAEPGKVFAQAQHTTLVQAGILEVDPVLALLDLTPEQIYARFQAGAWRWEYDLTPRSAAAFVQHYTEATGQPLDLSRAFGDSAQAVGNQVWQRYHGPNLFQQARKALKLDDWSLQQAARADLVQAQSVFAVTEALNWKQMETGVPRKVAADTWPVLVAYLILAVESPVRLATLHSTSARPPRLDQIPKRFTAYHDAINVWVMYFHFRGRRFTQLSTPESATLHALLADVMERAFKGKRLRTAPVQRLLMQAREWVQQHRREGQTFAGTFHLLLAYWKRQDWNAILAALPLGADVRPAFAAFAAATS